MTNRLAELLELSHAVGRDDRQLAILGEGNTSCRESETTFRVKASGTNLATLAGEGTTECRFEPLLDLLEQESATDEEVKSALLDSRVEPNSKKPSTEAVFHAFLLTLPGIEFVAHTHPVSVNGILCSPRAEQFAHGRQVPDEIVCCSRQSVLVPYTDPGPPLARAIRNGVNDFREQLDEMPRLILLQNHGLIAPAGSAAGALAASLMAEKAARIFQAAAALGGPVFLDEQNTARIEGRDDEAYRRQQLNL